MSLLDTLRKNLTPDLFSQVTDALGDDFNFDLVPRTRLNKVIGQRDKALRDLERLTQGSTDFDVDDDSDENNDGNEGGTDDGSKQKKVQKVAGITQKQLDEAIAAEQAKAATELKNLKLRFAVTEKLRGANIVDPEMVLNASLIDLAKVTMDDNGSISEGLDDQIAALTKDRPYLVSNGSAGGHKGTGKDGGSDQFSSVTSREEFLKLTAEKQMEFKKSNPEAFQQFMQNL